MSFQIIDEKDSSDTISNPGNELHTNALKHDATMDESRTSLVQQDIPTRLPWHGLAKTNSSKTESKKTPTNMDRMPLQYELHSNTKTHQLGGVYETYSALN